MATGIVALNSPAAAAAPQRSTTAPRHTTMAQGGSGVLNSKLDSGTNTTSFQQTSTRHPCARTHALATRLMGEG